MVSLMNDDVLGNGRNFVDDLLDSNMFTYEGLGLKGVKDDDGQISREEFEKLSEEDQDTLMDALTNRENPSFNEDTLVDMMSDYITSDIENQYNKMIGRGTAAEDKQLGYTQSSEADIDMYLDN
jgi:hypothetical protein